MTTQSSAQITHDQTPELYRLYRDVGDDSPWYDKAIWQAITTLADVAEGTAPAHVSRSQAWRRLQDIEKTLKERP